MKKLIVFLAFLLPLGLQAATLFKNYETTHNVFMRVENFKKETILIRKGAKIFARDPHIPDAHNPVHNLFFYINGTRYETSVKEFQSHIDNGDLKELEKPAPKPKTVQGPILH